MKNGRMTKNEVIFWTFMGRLICTAGMLAGMYWFAFIIMGMAV